MTTSFRTYDMSAEQIIAEFLDKHFYNQQVTDFIRFKDKQEQLKGKDVQFTLNDLKNIIVDEKAQLYYINKDIPTFAFEIDFLSSDKQLRKGWLFDAKKETKYYLLLQIHAKTDKILQIDDIKRLECILIKREDIIIYLIENGMDLNKSEEISNNLRKENLSGPQLKGKYTGFYFYYTDKLAEKPVNIVIYKDVLKQLAIKHFLVTKEKVQYLSS